MAIDKELLDILACPKCKIRVFLSESKDELICKKCRLLYRIEDSIPVMFADEAIKLDECVIEQLGRGK
jgi:hypothetical protein